MSLRIRIEHGQDAGKTWRFSRPGAYVIGRVPGTSMRVLDMKVSKAHATVEIGEDGRSVVLRDLESLHGTTLNGQPLKGAKPLKPGDEIRLGLSILRALSDGDADEEAEPKGAVTTDAAEAQTQAAGTAPKKRKTLPADALVDQEIGGYKVLQKIGQGGMGSVYTAEQLSLHRDVALKVLSEKFTSDRAFVDQFVNEARSAAALNHPNVVQVYDVGKEAGRYYFSMEFVPGGSLEERLAEEGRQPWQNGLSWMIDSANALIFASKRDILHRDVKPDNLMLAEDGSAKLCDLGLAKKAANPDMLAAGIIGTPAFISPEAIRRKKEIDGRSDLYSLGCAFYRVLTGENPYPGKTVKDILLGHLKSPVPRVSEKVPDIPRELDDAIYQLMQKEPGDRFESPEALLKSLDRIRIQHGLEAHGLRPGGKKPLVIALVALLLILGGALFFLTRKKPAGPTGMSEQERAKLEAAERDRIEAQRATFRSEATTELLGLDNQRLNPALSMENFRNPKWPELAGKFETLAERLESDATYGQDEEVLATAATAREHAKEVKEGVELRKGLASHIGGKVKETAKAFDDALLALRTSFDKALADGDWVGAYTAVSPEAIEALVGPYRKLTVQDILPDDVPRDARKAFEDDPLLDETKHLKPVIEKYFPGQPPGETLRQSVLQAARAKHTEALAAVNQAMAKGTREGFVEARELSDAWLADLPSSVDAGAGELATTIAKWRTQAERLGKKAARAEFGLQKAQLDHDQQAYFDLLRMLRKPRGLLPLFRIEPARKRAENDAKEMKDERYRALANAHAEDARALGEVFRKLQETYPAGWTTDKIEFVDERGRTQSEKVKAIDADGITVGKERNTWASLGAPWVVSFLFPAEGPRIAIDGALHRGVAVLSELAFDYDRAAKHYQAYLASPDASDTTVLRSRFGKLAEEKAAAEAWLFAVTTLEDLKAFLREHDPRKIGEEKFWASEEIRDEVLQKKAEYMKRLTEARQAEAALRDGRYRNTIWGTVLRKTLDPAARYADEGELVPPPDIDDEDDGKSPEEKPSEMPPEETPGDEPEKVPGE